MVGSFHSGDGTSDVLLGKIDSWKTFISRKESWRSSTRLIKCTFEYKVLEKSSKGVVVFTWVSDSSIVFTCLKRNILWDYVSKCPNLEIQVITYLTLLTKKNTIFYLLRHMFWKECKKNEDVFNTKRQKSRHPKSECVYCWLIILYVVRFCFSVV